MQYGQHSGAVVPEAGVGSLLPRALPGAHHSSQRCAADSASGPCSSRPGE